MPGEIATIADAVRSGRVRAINLVAIALARIDRIDPALNAVVARRDEAALADAQRIDEQVERGEDPGPLAGVPSLVKDLEHVAGMVTTQGSRLFVDADPRVAHGTIPQRLVDAGAVIVGKTNLPEFATEGYTANLLFGVTRNPWSLEHSPGGSSGGSAAAVAAGMVPIATATDGGGSIRIPAAFCGLVGIKPTNGVVGRWPPPDWLDLSTEGPLATSVDDLTLLWHVMAGPVAGDPTGVARASMESIADGGRVRQLFAIERFGSTRELADDVQKVFDTAVSNMSNVLNTTPVHVKAAELFGDANPDLDWFTVTTAEHVARFGRDWVTASLASMHPGARGFMQWGLKVTIDDYLAARRRRYDMVRSLDELLGADGVLVSPTVASAGWLADGRLTETGEPGMLPPDAFNTAVQNITGHPAVSLPAGWSGNGVPFGLQVTGPRYRDGLLLDLARLWEAQHPWPRWAPGYDGISSQL